MKLIANNKKAYHDYFIDDVYEAGLVLLGSEVKSIRGGNCSIKESYITVNNGEVFIVGMNITPFANCNTFSTIDPLRTRKLLLHKHQIDKLIGLTKLTGMTIMATKLYLDKGKVKIEIGTAKGKKNYDKRQDLAKKDAQRSIEREMKGTN